MADPRRWVTGWWEGKAGAAGAALSAITLPLEVAFLAGSWARNRLYHHSIFPVRRVPVPVISVGNLTVGGTGKTPVSAWIAATLRRYGREPCVLLRGYGLDEVQVHAELSPDVRLAIGADRAARAREAIAEGADCLVLDDGFQHRRLDRDLDVVLLAAEQWGGPHRLLPRGPWREPARALRRAGFILVTRKSASLTEGRRVLAGARRIAPDLPCGLVHLALSDFLPVEPGGAKMNLQEGADVTAVSSLGNPLAFEKQLRERGFHVAPLRYSDHHEFTAADADAIMRRAAGSPIVMTRKEAVKLRGMLPLNAPVFFADQKLIFEEGEQELKDLIARVISGN